MVVDARSGVVLRSVTGPSSFGYAADLRTGLGYLPVWRHECRMTLRLVTLGARPRAGASRPVARLRGGPIDSVLAQPVLNRPGTKVAIVLSTPGTYSPQSAPQVQCGSTQRLAVVSVGNQVTRRRPAVRYVDGVSGASLTALAWAGRNLIVTETLPQSPNRSVIRSLGSRDSRLTDARIVLRYRGNHPPPAFRFQGCLAVAELGSVRCVTNRTAGRPRAGGLPRRVDRASVNRNGRWLLVQTSNGDTYWWDGHASHRVPGRWDEAIW